MTGSVELVNSNELVGIYRLKVDNISLANFYLVPWIGPKSSIQYFRKQAYLRMRLIRFSTGRALFTGIAHLKMTHLNWLKLS